MPPDHLFENSPWIFSFVTFSYKIVKFVVNFGMLTESPFINFSASNPCPIGSCITFIQNLRIAFRFFQIKRNFETFLEFQTMERYHMLPCCRFAPHENVKFPLSC